MDPSGDTLISDSFIMRALDRPWIGQLRRQEAIQYEYFTDESAFEKYKDPELFYRSKDSIYYEKNGEMKVKNNEITGAISIGNSKYFWIHPPRSNQFRMLTYSAYLSTGSSALTDSTEFYSGHLNRYGLGRFIFDYEVHPVDIHNSLEPRLDSPDECWSINAISKLKCSDNIRCDTNVFNSRLESIYTKEYGFIEAIYFFADGTQISFYLEDIVKQ